MRNLEHCLFVTAQVQRFRSTKAQRKKNFQIGSTTCASVPLPLLLPTRILYLESQRDSVFQPKGAVPPLPWDIPRTRSNPNGVVSPIQSDATPLGLITSCMVPKVAKNMQPWANRHSPFGAKKQLVGNSKPRIQSRIFGV